MKLQSGVTLIEMVVVMAIVGILIGVGVPSFRYVTNSNRMSSEVNNLLGDMQFARSEALNLIRRDVETQQQGGECGQPGGLVPARLNLADCLYADRAAPAVGSAKLRLQHAQCASLIRYRCAQLWTDGDGRRCHRYLPTSNFCCSTYT